MSNILRIAICQLRCHPALQTAHLMYLAEPFVPSNHRYSLSSLSINGFSVDTLMEVCKERYLNWHRERLRSLFSFLLEVKPNVTIFAEGAIPFQTLDLVKEFSDKTGSAIFSGTHTFQNTRNSRRRYQEIGLSNKTIGRLLKHDQTNNMAPVFIDNRVHFFPKHILSPFERNDVSNFESSKKPIVPLKLTVKGKDISILLLICSEALNFTKINVQGHYEMAVILSCDNHPKRFDAVTDLLTSNNKVVAYCNDGHFGGSKIQLPRDGRVPSWWFDSNLGGVLPPGDSVLIAEIDFDNLAPQVGITEPRSNFKLIKLNSVTYSKDPGTFYATQEAKNAIYIEDNNAKSEMLKKASMCDKCDNLQAEKYRYLSILAESGQHYSDWWSSLGEDIIINLPSLNQVEAELSLLCYSQLAELLVETDAIAPGYENLKLFLKQARLRSGKIAETEPKPTQRERYEAIIDRDEDSKAILNFFDHKYQKIIQVLGIQQIGKTSVVKKALEQCKFERVLEVEVFDTSSVDYILRKLFYDHETLSETADLHVSSLDDEIERVLENNQLIWFHRTENLKSHNNWRNPDIGHFFLNLAKISQRKKCKIVLETRVSLQLDIDDPNITARKRVYGLEGTLSRHGITYLDYQLRRVDLSPNDIDADTKSYIVEKLGGHPFAISLCADAIVDEGLTAVVQYLKNKKGFYLSFVNHIIQSINLNEQEQTILKLLSLIRLSIPREILLHSFNDVTASTSLNNLLQLCLVEIDTNSNIRLPGLLKSYFDSSEIDENLRLKFHQNCGAYFAKAYDNNRSRIEFAIEADVHNSLGRKPTRIAEKLFDGQIEIAKRFYDNQNYQFAKQALDQIPDQNKTHDVLRLSSIIDAKCNQFDSALRSALKVFTYNRSDTYLLSEISRIALSQGRDDIADKLIGTARAAQMEDTSILLVEGRMLLRRNKLPQAEEAFLQALKLTKKNPWPYFYLGRIYIRTGELDRAIEILHDGEVFIYEGKFRNENALSAIRTQLGIAYLLNDQIDLAEQTISSLYQERNKDPEVIRAYAMISLKKEGIEKAFEAFQRLSQGKIKSKYDEAQFHLYYGIFYLGIGDKGNASTEFAKAHQADKNNVYIMMKLAKTYYDLAIQTWIDGEFDIAKSFASDCSVIVKKIMEFDSDNQIGKDIQIDLYTKFGIELSKI